MSEKKRKEVPLYICPNGKRGSFTLEAAVIVPLAAGFLASLLFFFPVLETETEVYAALNYASRRAAAMAPLTEGEVAQLAIAEGFFLSKLADSETAKNYLTGATKLLALADSDADGEYVRLVADYRIKFPIAFFPIRDIHIRQECKSRKWVGAVLDSGEESYVYVTEHGTVYHLTKDCNYLDLSIQSVNPAKVEALRNFSGHKYFACERCVANGSNSIVYITDYGDCYHENIACSGLKRTVALVALSEVSDKKLCSKCAKKKKGK